MRKEYGKHPQVNFVDSFFKTPFEAYQLHHVLVSPHLSEGFGLVPLEAMATGMTCMVSRCSAPREYFNSRFGWWIEMSEDYVPVSDCLPETSGFWRLPSLDSLAAGMRDVYNRRDEGRERGLQASVFALANYSWKSTAAGIVAAITKFLGERSIR
jgi:glycosyltransferase involved in cell wall biosynthesis